MKSSDNVHFLFQSASAVTTRQKKVFQPLKCSNSSPTDDDKNKPFRAVKNDQKKGTRRPRGRDHSSSVYVPSDQAAASSAAATYASAAAASAAASAASAAAATASAAAASSAAFSLALNPPNVSSTPPKTLPTPTETTDSPATTSAPATTSGSAKGLDDKIESGIVDSIVKMFDTFGWTVFGLAAFALCAGVSGGLPIAGYLTDNGAAIRMVRSFWLWVFELLLGFIKSKCGGK